MLNALVTWHFVYETVYVTLHK